MGDADESLLIILPVLRRLFVEYLSRRLFVVAAPFMRPIVAEPVVDDEDDEAEPALVFGERDDEDSKVTCCPGLFRYLVPG